MMGRGPMLTMGLGMVSEYSRRRVPNPPQKRTTFTIDPPWSRASCRELLQQARRLQQVRGAANGTEFPPRASRDVEQRVFPIREIEDPEQGQLVDPTLGEAAHGAIEPTLAELRLALGAQIQIALVALERLDDGQDGIQRLGERGG